MTLDNIITTIDKQSYTEKDGLRVIPVDAILPELLKLRDKAYKIEVRDFEKLARIVLTRDYSAIVGEAFEVNDGDLLEVVK